MTTLVRRSWRAIIAAAGFALPLQAQDSTSKPRDTWTTAFTFGIPGVGMEALPSQLMIAGMQFTNLNSGKLSGDFSVGLSPVALFAGLLAFGVRGGLALPMQMTPTSYIVPSAGVSFLGVMGVYGTGAGLPGMNAGISVIRGGPSDGGVRMGVTWHTFADFQEPYWLAEFGILAGKSRR